MIEFYEINNLSTHKNDSPDAQTNTIDYEDLSGQIANLVNMSMTYSNSDTYTSEEFEKLSRNKTAESMLDLIKYSYVVYLTNDENEIIGCGMVVRQDNRFFSKTLHVRPDYRGFGYAQQICDRREDFLRSIGEKEVYIESLKYPKTLAFHKKRGFVEIPPYKELKHTVLMKKNLN